MPLFAKECDSKRIESVSVYHAKLAAGGGRHKIRLYNVLFLLAYLYQAGWIISTIGEPYRQFLEKADREGFQVMEGSTRLRAELEHSFRDLNDPNRRTKKIGWTDWMDMDIEELAAEKKRDKERNVLDSLPKSMRVPKRYAPSFWPSLVMGVLVVLHALLLLMQYWSVSFNVWINYREMDAEMIELPESMLELDLDEAERASSGAPTADNSHGGAGAASRIPDRKILQVPAHLPTHARIIPAKGRHILVPLEYYPTLGMTFEYHRRRYVYDPETATWSKVRCRTDFSLKFLESWTGFPSSSRLVAGQIRYGPNMFSVRQPTFIELYKAQLLNPFSVFQIFCVLLWAIDDYLIYSFFSLFMVLMFEGTVVFQRLRSLQALRTMGNPSRHVYVYRSEHWTVVDTTELLPGDIMSLTRVKPHHAKAEATGENKDKDAAGAAAPIPTHIEDEGGDIVPADLLLLRGSTVVNEASLTGESVPQMKEGLSELEENESLSMKNRHKMNVVYAGTKMLQCKGATDYLDEDAPSPAKVYGKIPTPPDDGCVCFVLRTGFASAQGKLVRMIEGSQEKVKGHERETGLLLLLLCFFAIVSSSYVLYHGAQNENRSKYELLLHCILIVTSVIRPELPMQMALAVNNSLMTLMRMHVFCTEPYRVPMAGKLDACLFDKTGTLTTDELVAVGVCEPVKLSIAKGKESESEDFLTPMAKVNGEAALVLAGCHSLIVVDKETTGDPLESAALIAMRWQIASSTGNAVPAPATDMRAGGATIRLKSGQSMEEVHILARHHFSSKLQRMSCVIKCGGSKFSVAKGSPEAIGRLLATKPVGYDEKSEYLAKQGYRVIALAYKPLATEAEADAAKETRAACEAELTFCGFMAFTCMVRKDTSNVLRRLKEGGMSVAMVTGDALLTAIHVAKEVGICEAVGEYPAIVDVAEVKEEKKVEEETNEELIALLESRGRKRKGHEDTTKEKLNRTFKPIAFLELSENGTLFWRSYDDGSRMEDYSANNLPSLSSRYELATTGKCLAEAFEQDPLTTKFLAHIKVFARMTPDAKETVIECLHSVGSLCLMCGDGANDVGALKQADVGVALLTGFGNLNVDRKETEEDIARRQTKKEDEITVNLPKTIISKQHLDEVRALPLWMIKMHIKKVGADLAKYPELVEKEDLVKLYEIKAKEDAIKKYQKKNEAEKGKISKQELALKKKAEWDDKQRRMQIRIQELEAQGVQYAALKAMREFWNEEMNASKKKKNEIAKKGGIEESAASLVGQLEQLESADLPMVKLGDASIAAPFTSKMPSIRSCVDIVRQGRCTLVSSIQMYQIMALQCLISSYSLSALYLEGVKYGDSQLTAMGMLGSVSFMSVSRSKPLDKLSRVRPLSSIFHPALIFSLLGQFAIHLSTMIIAVQGAKRHLPEGYQIDLDGTFKPGILNTVFFLVSSVQQVTVFVVNLQGRPFMTGVMENRPLLLSLVATFILTFMFATESVPGLNRYFQLVPFPEATFRDFILAILVINLVATFAFDRLMQFIFAREILVASFEGFGLKDLFGIARVFFWMFLLMYTFMGNSDQWDQILLIQEAMERGENVTNITEVLAKNISGCVGAACHALNETAAAVHDEF